MYFRLGKLHIELSFPLCAIMTAAILFDTTMSFLVCIIAAAIHESGHLLALYRFNSFPKRIKLTLFDIAIIDVKKYSRSIGQELIIVLAGVTANFISGIIFYIIYRICGIPLFLELFVSSMSLGIFNSLPVDTLDGGQALFLILSLKLSLQCAGVILNIISFIILLPTAVLGFLVLLNSKYNFTLLLTAVYLIAVLLLKNRKT